ncbi:hypothetical protein K3495_g1463 [Podosphaera aphanis]|nr:hypothetical protein K3495_g1463 [Podosphaera aphanis]
MRNAYLHAALFLILTKSFLSAFKVTTDGFRLHNQMSVDEKLRILNEVEEDIRSQSGKVLVARQKTFKKSKKARPNQGSESDSDNPGYSCYLCKNVDTVARCPRLETAARLLKEHDKAKKSEPVVKRRSPNKNFRKKPKTSRNHKAYAVGSSPSTEEYTCSDLSETENEDVEEFHLSKEKICKTTPSDWPVDTGATSHMSDQPLYFRKLIPMYPRRVKVGGGELRAEFEGDVQMRCKDGSSMLLSNVLFVPNLGINLLSVRRMCQAELNFVGNENKLFLKLGNQNNIEARMTRGLYAVTHIAQEYEERAFTTVENDMQMKDSSSLEINDNSVQNSDNEVVRKHELERYLKYHRRFAHLGPEKIWNLHLVTTLKKRIKVPRDLDVCDVCAPTNMKNRIPKTLSLWSKEILGQIHFDVAGLFPTSIRALKTWKVITEHQTEKKVKTARSDNAPELLKDIHDWKVEDGIQAQSTTIASSHQNGPAERSIQTVEFDMRAMLEETQFQIDFWDEAVEADSYMRNRTGTGPTISNEKTSPMKAFTGQTPSIDHVRKWATRVGVFMGYSENATKNFKVYSPERGYTILSGRVVIKENEKGCIVDLRIRNSKSGPQGMMNVTMDRTPRGRPRNIEIAQVQSNPHLSTNENKIRDKNPDQEEQEK